MPIGEDESNGQQQAGGGTSNPALPGLTSKANGLNGTNNSRANGPNGPTASINGRRMSYSVDEGDFSIEESMYAINTPGRYDPFSQ